MGERQLGGKITGTVTSINATGAAVTDISVDQLRDVPHDDQVSIACEGHVTGRLFPPDHGQPEMTFLAILSDDGFLELHLVGDRVNTFLGIQDGSPVTVRW